MTERRAASGACCEWCAPEAVRTGSIADCRYASIMADDSGAPGHAGNHQQPDRPGLGDRRAGSRLRRWELVILAVALLIVVVAIVTT